MFAGEGVKPGQLSRYTRMPATSDEGLADQLTVLYGPNSARCGDALAGRSDTPGWNTTVTLPTGPGARLSFECPVSTLEESVSETWSSHTIRQS